MKVDPFADSGLAVRVGLLAKAGLGVEGGFCRDGNSRVEIGLLGELALGPRVGFLANAGLGVKVGF